MSKTRKLLIALMLLIAVLLIPNMVNATVEYTKSVEGNDGSITINLTGLELESEKSYQFSLVPPGSYATEWHLITEKTNTTAKIYLSSATTDIVNALKIADNAKLIIRENEDTTNTPVAELDVNLKLPYLNAVNVSGNLNDGYTVRTLYGYDNNSMSFNWEKITDATVIEKYLAYKNNGTEISALDLKQTVPTSNFSTNWGMVASANNYCKIYKSDIPDDGLYYLWIKSSDDNCKQITGYYIHDGLPNATTLEDYVGVVNGAPTVDSITARGNSGNLTNIPGTGLEYHPTVGDEITVNIKFNQAIVKNTAPTLTIKFGTGNNIELTTCQAGSDTLTYKYTVKEGDLGTLQVVSFTGGNVTNNEDTAAVLTLPELSGYKVVAIEGNATPEEPKEPEEYISFPFIIYFGTTTIDLKQGVYDGEYTMYYQFVEVTNENEETNYDDTKWVKMEDGKPEAPSLEYTGEKKFDLWVKLEMTDKTVYESYRYRFNGSTPVSNVNEKKTFNSHTYQIIDKLMSWQEAKEYCESLGGYLVTITSAEEQEFIASLVKEQGFAKNRFWMGATDEDQEKTWKWITGEKFSYTNWGTGQPNNNESGGQNYGVYVGKENSFSIYAEKWDDINEDSEDDIYFICEWGEPVKDTTTATDKLPDTGKVLLIWIIGIIAVSGIVAHIRYKKLYM